MMQCYAQGHANPASQHRPGQRARRALEDARERIAAILGANLTCTQPDRLIFTASGTEANNLAVLGIARSGRHGPEQIVISSIEHQSVIEPARTSIRTWLAAGHLGRHERWSCTPGKSFATTERTQPAGERHLGQPRDRRHPADCRASRYLQQRRRAVPHRCRSGRRQIARRFPAHPAYRP